jgi:hypothetical protein
VAHWKSIHVGKRGDRLKIGGISVWDEEWRSDGRTVQLPHPLHTTESFAFRICEIGTMRAPVRFAAGQVGAGVWAFYVED